MRDVAENTDPCSSVVVQDLTLARDGAAQRPVRVVATRLRDGRVLAVLSHDDLLTNGAAAEESSELEKLASTKSETYRASISATGAHKQTNLAEPTRSSM